MRETVAMTETPRVALSAEMLEWLANRSGKSTPEMLLKHPKWAAWLSGETHPTLEQAKQLARAAGVPFGYLLLEHPPQLKLPVSDFREGIDADLAEPSSDLLAVVHQSILRQDWYRDFAADHGLPEVGVVGTGADREPEEVAAQMRRHLDFEVEQRRGTWSEVRKHLLRAFEGLGGLTVATSMVENNTHRMLSADEFRGFSLVDRLAPLVFVNTNQTLNGQIFTLGHEFAHIWLGRGGVGLEDPKREPSNRIEAWCNAAASQFLVPPGDLRERFSELLDRPLTEQLEALAAKYRCGTLVVLQALRRHGVRRFDDFDHTYDAELLRLTELSREKVGHGGNHYANQPFRVGERFSRAIISEALAGRTPLSEALRLTSLKSLSSLDTYADRLGVA